LRELVSTRGLSRFARDAMLDLSNFSPVSDSMRLFSLNALALWQSVRPEFEQNLAKLEGDAANQVQVDLLLVALEKFDRITNNLIRIAYPFQEQYGAIANLRACFARLQQVAEDIRLRDEWKLPGFLKLLQVRQLVRKIKQSVLDLDAACGPEFKRYIDLITFYDFIQMIQSCDTDFRQVEKKDEPTAPAGDKPTERRSGKAGDYKAQKKLKSLKNRLSGVEKRVQELETQLADIDHQLLLNYDQTIAEDGFFDRYQGLKDQLDELMQQWETLTEAVEEAEH
jgi:hypothetical protein